MDSIKINSKIRLTDIGAHEQIYEGVKVEVDATLFEDRLRLDCIYIDSEASDYMISAGSTAKHWMAEVKSAFDNDPEYVLDCITDRMSEEQWQTVKDVVVLYKEGQV